jgi:hypothetical protein
MNFTALELYRSANVAAREAIQFRRAPDRHGGCLAAVRQRDARQLRVWAREAARREAGLGSREAPAR